MNKAAIGAVLALVPGLLMTGTVGATGDIARGQAKSATCVACHNADGNSTNSEWPKLAGQNVRYLEKQLRDIIAGETRQATLMVGLVANFSEQDIEDVSAYFASQTMSGGFANEETLALGQKIYRGGNTATGLPACAGCHGPTGAGNAPGGIPRVGGQHAVYNFSQLKLFQRNVRSNDPAGMMQDVVRFMTEKEMRAVAEYMSGLH